MIQGIPNMKVNHKLIKLDIISKNLLLTELIINIKTVIIMFKSLTRRKLKRRMLLSHQDVRSNRNHQEITVKRAIVLTLPLTIHKDKRLSISMSRFNKVPLKITKKFKETYSLEKQMRIKLYYVIPQSRQVKTQDKKKI
eukprot:403365443